MCDNMLRKFTVENFRNFRDPITLDFSKKHEYQFNDYCIKDGLISKMVVFGENGSGKSNLGLALFDIVAVLTDNECEQIIDGDAIFLNADSGKRMATFTYEFKFGDTIVEYTYKKSKPEKIDSETVTINGLLAIKYTRQSHKLIIGVGEAAKTLNFDNKPDHLSVVRFIYNNSKLDEDDPVALIVKFANKMLWFRSLHNRNYIGFRKGSQNIAEYLVEKNKVPEFEKFLEKVAGIKVSLSSYRDPITQQVRLIERHAKKSLNFMDAASTGTRELLLFFFWSMFFEEVSFLFVDEFDAFYHFELSRELIKYVAQLNNVQAVFTSHNTYLASNEVLRPDCYMKLRDGQIYSFADSTTRELREGHNIEKMLRNGEFDG